MTGKLTKTALVFVSLLLLGAMCGVTACGDATETGNRIVTVGILTDYTGPGSSATVPCAAGFVDELKTANDQNTIPGVEFKWVTYDQRSDPARVPVGYTWLKSRGVDLMYILSPTDRAILADIVTADKMPVVGSSLEESSPNHPWMFSLYGSFGHDAEAAMLYIMQSWDYDGEGRAPKVGHITWTLPSGVMKQAGIDKVLAAYPEKFQWMGCQAAPAGTATWVAEIGRLKDCDYIFVGLISSMSATFMNEARARGYTGRFISDNTAFGGYFDLIRGVVPADQLYDCYQVNWVPLWSEDLPFTNRAREILEEYRPDDVAAYTANTGYLHGILFGMPVTESVKQAAAEVGADKIDGEAIRDALDALEIDMTTNGFGVVWRFTEGFHCLCRAEKAYRWDVASQQWQDAGTGWITPLSLAD